ncbi:secE/sec61-gamma protein transport protein [Perilla frutescens var. hirtella]|uniref:SecE/sec61-gamma protein transport protein n=1 Tax=Perilla frutescens var. hirtella TaxID=608512 RepID=A0AAD4P7A9_PERFH|nr:secE/sec61-gamma protein transport protein [Perilla frutescens var. hirtella]
MAVSVGQFQPGFPSTMSVRSPKSRRVAKPTTILSKEVPTFPVFASKPRSVTTIRKNSPDGEEKIPARESDEMTELGKEIKQAMEEREGKESGFVSGVVEEIREIEWPAFNKVLRTTGVVLGVIAGSSVVLLTVNAVLAQISDTLFAGRGLQDFFAS